ncbi:MAG: GRP family sugar transporter [Planctomycetaceae bacterium]|nr:GRP family sugar transporter [Planctomycetaceae bacterium]
MVVLESYPIAVLMCVICMLCWGSWANTQKLASKDWKFQLFYWDYAIGVLVLSLIMAFTMGSHGTKGANFLSNVAQATSKTIMLALIGGIVFNISNILLVRAIDVAGLAVAFPVGVGLALVIGVINNYITNPVGNAAMLFIGVAGVVAAIIIDGLAYKKLSSTGQKTATKGIVLSVLAGVLMGWFFWFVAQSMSSNFVTIEPGKFTPYSAVVFFSIGVLVSNFIWNTKPFTGSSIQMADYFKGSMKLHLIGILGGIIWNTGMSFSIIASGQAGFAISYGLGQGATLVAAFWGVFIWKEFKNAPKGVNPMLALMFLLYIVGLTMIIVARLA